MGRVTCTLSPDARSSPLGSDHVDKGLCDQYYDTDPRVKHGCAQSQPRDPQFLGNKRYGALALPPLHCAVRGAPLHPLTPPPLSLASWISRVNHEIDIEIPANCMGTSVCAPTAEPCSADVPGEKTNCNFTARKDTCVVGRRCRSAGPAHRHPVTLVNPSPPLLQGLRQSLPHVEPEQLHIHHQRGHRPRVQQHVRGRAQQRDGGALHAGRRRQLAQVHHRLAHGERGGERARRLLRRAWPPLRNRPPRRNDFPGRALPPQDDVFIGSNNVFVPTRASRLLVGSWDGGGNKVNGKKQNVRSFPSLGAVVTNVAHPSLRRSRPGPTGRTTGAACRATASSTCPTPISARSRCRTPRPREPRTAPALRAHSCDCPRAASPRADYAVQRGQ